MTPTRVALFVIASFGSAALYYAARAAWHAAVPTLMYSNLLHYVFDLVVPVVLALVVARAMGLWRVDTGLAGKAVIILVAAFIWFPAKVFDTYIALEACGAFGGCFN